jgi:transcriptional regulator with XRE-family HTH domain
VYYKYNSTKYEEVTIMAKRFGEFFQEKRIATGLTLRKFCQTHKLDPGNISKLERGLFPPPESAEKLERYAQNLRLKPGTDDWYEFFDLAAAERGRIPQDVMQDEQLVEKLPMVFRTMRGDPVSEESLRKLAQIIRKSHSAE